MNPGPQRPPRKANAQRILEGIEMLEKSFSDRIIPIDGPVVNI